MKYKEYIIPKKNGKIRKIVAPDNELKKFQKGYIKKLEAIFKIERAKYKLPKSIIHGFIKQRNCVTAAKEHIGFEYTVMMDISNFFDSVHINHIPPEYKLDWKLFHKEGYAAQGFPSSPMVANIATVPVMSKINNELKQITSEFAITIYADDIFISANDDTLIPKIREIITTIFNAFGFNINENKTRIKFSKYGYRRILGVNVGTHKIRATRKTMKKLRAAKYQAINKLNKKAHMSAGGLKTWSKCLLPKSMRPVIFNPNKTTPNFPF